MAKEHGWTKDKDETGKLSIVQEIMIRSLDCLRRIIAPVGGQKRVTMSYLCPKCNSFPLEDDVWWVSGWKGQQLVVHDLWRKIRLEKTKQAFWLYKQVKVSFRPRSLKQAVPQSLCGNLINALKLLANQQEDGDGLIQKIVRNLGKESRKGLTEGLTEFIKIDNVRALVVGYLNRGMGNFTVRKPKVPEGCPEVTVRESTVTKSSDELTLRAEKVAD